MPFDGDLSAYLQVAAPVVESGPQRIIRAARTTLADEAHWCRGDFRIGDAFCILGALRLAHSGAPRRSGTGGASRYVARVVRTRGFRGIQDFNDSFATHCKVLEVLDEAYALAGKG
jgi:hypothetical protein